jgi:hypothetical protein
LKQGDALSLLLLDFALEYAITGFKEKTQGLKLDGTHELLFCADDVNILGENIDYHTENRRALSDATKEVGPEVNPEKTKYTRMLMSCYYKAGQDSEWVLWRCGKIQIFENNNNI